MIKTIIPLMLFQSLAMLSMPSNALSATDPHQGQGEQLIQESNSQTAAGKARHRHAESSVSTTTLKVPETIDSQGKLSPLYQKSNVIVHTSVDADPESLDFYPTALVANDHILTYIAGTPVVSSPYLGNRPAFDGSDYIVNISSINRDVRLMQQRRSLSRAYVKLGYKAPDRPILALSGAVVPMGTIGQP